MFPDNEVRAKKPSEGTESGQSGRMDISLYLSLQSPGPGMLGDSVIAFYIHLNLFANRNGNSQLWKCSRD